ncbi:MAG TPA: TonB family protein [Chthoniobacterales bacterium]|jgi:TonB family protein|nr:TonB family protein [Chthoniobacterales bacterium]
MRQSTLALICGLILFVVLAYSWCGRNPPTQVSALAPTPTPTPLQAAPTASAAATASAVAQASPTPPLETPPPEFQNVVHKAEPAIIEITVFDAKGQLLRAANGFFVSRDGLFVTSTSAIADGAYGVAKSSDGKIRNVSGVIASSPESELALLRAETKVGVPFLPLSKTSESIVVGAWAAAVGSSLQHKEQPVAAGKISARGSDPKKDSFQISGAIPPDASGAPVVDDQGEVVGIVTAGGKNEVRPASLLDPLLAQAKPGTTGRWAAAPLESPTATPTPRIAARKVLYNPGPKFPFEARSMRLGPNRGSGRYRVTFDPSGVVKNVQVVTSTGQSILDQAAVDALRQWRVEPGPSDWTVLVPVTFQP